MNGIIYDDEIITPQSDSWNYYEKFTKKLNGRDCIKFILFCAKIFNPNIKESNLCIELVEKLLIDKKLVSRKELHAAIYSAAYSAASATYAAYSAASAAYAANYFTESAYAVTITSAACSATSTVNYIVNTLNFNVDKINKYLQILLRKTQQFQNNQVLEQISKGDVDKLELVDWNMITDIMQEDYDIIHEFDYEDIFSRRCLIELLRREYT